MLISVNKKNEKNLTTKSKFLSLVLRHDPGLIDLTLDKNGWANVDELLTKSATKGQTITTEELLEIVQTNEKKRFNLDLTANRIRANQGHSIEVDLELTPTLPPPLLYHGSARKNRDSILLHGLLKGERQHVHLSADIETAHRVGSRHGSPIIFKVHSHTMHSQGHHFYQSKNGV